MDFVKREAQNLIDEEQYKAYIESVSVVEIFNKILIKINLSI